MTTRTLGFGLLSAGLLVSLSACNGKDAECDTAAGEICNESDADADADSDSDTDSDADADAGFDDYVVAMDFITGYQDGAHVAVIGTDGSAIDPYVEITVYEEAYFDAGDDRYSCTWYGYFSEVAADNLGVDGLWYGAEVAFTAIEGGTDCANFDEDRWGASDPTAVFESFRWGLGWGPLGPNVGPSFEQAVREADIDWETEWAPYAYSYYLGYTNDAGMSFADSETVSDLGYAIAFDVNPADMSIIVDADGNASPLELGSASELPSAGFLQGRAWYLPYTANFTGE